MILEHVVLPIRAGRETEFEAAFAEARSLIEAATGLRGLSPVLGVEHPDTYLLLVECDSVEAHEIGFRTSADSGRWGDLLHGLSDPFPTVTRFGPILCSGPSGHPDGTMKRMER